VTQRLGVVQPENLDIGHIEAATFNGGSEGYQIVAHWRQRT
jgi:hypothetical protein